MNRPWRIIGLLILGFVAVRSSLDIDREGSRPFTSRLMEKQAKADKAERSLPRSHHSHPLLETFRSRSRGHSAEVGAQAQVQQSARRRQQVELARSPGKSKRQPHTMTAKSVDERTSKSASSHSKSYTLLDNSGALLVMSCHARSRSLTLLTG